MSLAGAWVAVCMMANYMNPRRPSRFSSEFVSSAGAPAQNPLIIVVRSAHLNVNNDSAQRRVAVDQINAFSFYFIGVINPN